MAPKHRSTRLSFSLSMVGIALAACAGEGAPQQTAGSGALMGEAGSAGSASAAGSGSTAGAAGSLTAPIVTSCEGAVDLRTGAQCQDAAQGVFAIKTEIDVWWQDTASPPLVDPGRGIITLYLMAELAPTCANGSGGVAVTRGCGTYVPPFTSDANCDAFQTQFPDALWDQSSMPTFTTQSSTTGFSPGDVVSLSLAAGLVGIDLNDPGSWPDSADDVTCAAGSIADCFPDHDGDGKPGITVHMARIGEPLTTGGCGASNQPYVFRGAPLDALGGLVDDGVKAEELYVGVGTRLGGSTAIGADCASGIGDSQAELIASRVIDCVRTDGMPCTITDSQFIDANTPRYNVIPKRAAPPVTILKGNAPLDQTPSHGPRSSVVRLGDNGSAFSCADVRAASFPAF